MRKFLNLKEDGKISYDIKSSDVLLFLSGLIIFNVLGLLFLPEEVRVLVVKRGEGLYLFSIVSNIILFSLLRRSLTKEKLITYIYVIGVLLFMIELAFLKYEDLYVLGYFGEKKAFDEGLRTKADLDSYLSPMTPSLLFFSSHHFSAFWYSFFGIIYLFLPEKKNIQKNNFFLKTILIFSACFSISIPLSFMAILLILVYGQKIYEFFI